MNGSLVESIRFGADGLVPVVVQDAVTRDVLMLAYMNEEALRLTRETARSHFWSRSRSRLWRKGETSGNEQIVRQISINCERNSLLLLVDQVGAVCHDGYDTCFYRSLDEDGTLETVRTRVFDPAMVYAVGVNELAGRDLTGETRLQFNAYVYLRDHDVGSLSATSRRLRGTGEEFGGRVADELRELAAVLDGTHVHTERKGDVALEASQVIYWIYLIAIRGGFTWTEIRPDRALEIAEDGVTEATVTRLITREAARWDPGAVAVPDIGPAAHAALSLVGQACRVSGVDPFDVVQLDLAELMKRPYLEPYFAGQPAKARPE